MSLITTLNDSGQWLGHVVNLFTCAGVFWGLYQKRRESRPVKIWATCGDERKLIAEVPAKFLTRAEVMGLVGQKAGAARVDLSKFVFNYGFVNVIWVPLSTEDFAKIPA